jgi:glutamate racemase
MAQIRAWMRPSTVQDLMASTPTILVFDSGLGGLTVHREIAEARPDAHYVYDADDAFFPYSAHSETALVERVTTLMATLIETHRPDLIVIATPSPVRCTWCALRCFCRHRSDRRCARRL